MSSAHVKSRLSLPANRWPRAWAMVAALTLLTGMAWLVPLFAPTFGGWIVGGVGVVSVIAVSVLFINRAWALTDVFMFKTLTVAAMTVATLTAMISMFAALSLEMARTGTRHTAIVTAERKVDPWYSKTADYHYQLSVNGHRLTGELIIGSDDLDPGDVVDVYSAPGQDRLELADEVEDGPTTAVMASIGYLISLPLCLAAGYSAPPIAYADSRRARSRSRKRRLTKR